MRLHVAGTLGTMGRCTDNDFHLIIVLWLHEMQTIGDTERPLFLQDLQIPKCENFKHGIKHKLWKKTLIWKPDWAILFSDLCILSLQKREKESFIKTVTFLWGHFSGIGITKYHNDNLYLQIEVGLRWSFQKGHLIAHHTVWSIFLSSLTFFYVWTLFLKVNYMFLVYHSYYIILSNKRGHLAVALKTASHCGKCLQP